MPFISVITPVYNSTKTLKAYLDAIFGSTYKHFEMILIDDGSQEDFQGLLKAYPKVIFKKLEQRHGAYYARNIGAKEARGDILFFLDADISIRNDTLENIVEEFHRRQDIFALIGSYDDEPGAPNTVSQFKFLYHHYIHQHELEYVGSFWTACGAIKKEVFCKLGGFNTEIFRDLNTINDIDFGYRLKREGYQVYNARYIQVKHLKRLSFFEWIMTDIFKRGLPWMKILLEYKDFSPTLNINILSILSVICVWLGILLCVLSMWNNNLFWTVIILGGVFLGCNSELLRFFLKKRGGFFVFTSIPLLFIYYFNCGLCILMFPFFYKRI